MHTASIFSQRTWGLVLIALLLASCTEEPTLKAHDDPAKYNLVKDVLWASPRGFDLTMDIYTPTSLEGPFPVIVMFHGGGWLINDKSIMEQAAAYLATNSKYVVCNVNYRLLTDNDNTVGLNEIVNDAFGAVLWVKDNIDQHQGDRSRIVVTGDIAGAHLSAMILNSGNRLSSEAFSTDSLSFTPSYLPQATTAEDVAEQNGLAVQAAILSYGVFDSYDAARNGMETFKNPFWLFGGSLPRGLFGDNWNIEDHPSLYQATSPFHNIPQADDRRLPPQLLTVGTEDSLATPKSVKAYGQLLQDSGHHAQYWEYQAKSHAYLDSGSNALLGSSFAADAPVALDVMIGFLDEIFYPEL